MGLLICLVSYGIGLASVLGVAAQVRRELMDPEGVGDVELLVVAVALASLSALFGARTYEPWLKGSMRLGALAGIAGGALTGAALTAFALVATTLDHHPYAAVLLLIGRFTFIVWPAFILSASIATVRRSAAKRTV